MRVAIVFLALASWLLADKIYELNIPNMNCGGCASKIKQAASSVGEVKGFTQNFQTKDVNITLNDNTDIKKVLQAINDADYRAKLKR